MGLHNRSNSKTAQSLQPGRQVGGGGLHSPHNRSSSKTAQSLQPGRQVGGGGLHSPPNRSSPTEEQAPPDLGNVADDIRESYFKMVFPKTTRFQRIVFCATLLICRSNASSELKNLYVRVKHK